MLSNLFPEPPSYVLENSYMQFGTFWEVFNLSLFVILLTFCYKKYGKYTALKIYGIGMLYGMVLENGGPLFLPELGFPGFFFEHHYMLYLFQINIGSFTFGTRISQVPLATHFGWSNVFFISFVWYETITQAYPQLKQGKIKSIIYGFLIMSTSGLLRDLQLDPTATRYKWWIWNENLVETWFGVPMVNFIAWFWAVGAFGAFWVYVHQKQNQKGELLTEKEQTILLAKLLPLIWVFDLIFVTITNAIFNNMGLLWI